MNPSTAMSTNVRSEPLALITCLETWKQVEINLKPRMTCVPLEVGRLGVGRSRISRLGSTS